MIAPSVLGRVRGAYRRRAARWFNRRPFAIPAGRALVSFTFDDFPRSSLLTGGALLQHYGFAGTYYVSLGLAGTPGPGGGFFRTDDLPGLLAAGHELGCHTFHHYGAWETHPELFEASVLLNASALSEHLPEARLHTLSYPISYPRPETKWRVSSRFACCRSGGQAYNVGTVDLNYLSSYFLEQSHDRLGAVKDVLHDCIRNGGWLIFSTHEVCPNPSRFGCTPEFFHAVVKSVADSDVAVLPVYAALQELRGRGPSA